MIDVPIIDVLREPGLREQVSALTHALRDTLGDAMLGAYLYGSAAAGGLRPFSDVDVLVVADRPLVGHEAAALLARLLPLSGQSGGRGPARPLELTVLVRALLAAVPVLIPGIEEGDDVRNGLLTLARIWTTLATGDIRPKDAAADFALERLPAEHRPVLAHARAVYRGEAPEDWAGLSPQLMPHVRHVVERIRAAAAAG